jgi:hypothetical protein
MEMLNTSVLCSLSDPEHCGYILYSYRRSYPLFAAKSRTNEEYSCILYTSSRQSALRLAVSRDFSTMLLNMKGATLTAAFEVSGIVDGLIHLLIKYIRETMVSVDRMKNCAFLDLNKLRMRYAIN